MEILDVSGCLAFAFVNAHNMLDLLVKRYFTACAVGVKHARRQARMWAAAMPMEWAKQSAPS